MSPACRGAQPRLGPARCPRFGLATQDFVEYGVRPDIEDLVHSSPNGMLSDVYSPAVDYAERGDHAVRGHRAVPRSRICRPAT